MKFDISKDTKCQTSYFISRPDLVTFRGIRGDLKSWKTFRVEGSG